MSYNPETCEYRKVIANIQQWHEDNRIDKLKKLKKSGVELEKDYYFLTVNPKPTVNLEEFHKLIQKAISKKWISYYLYVIEQRGETLDEIGKGIHTHIIFNKGIKHCKVIKEMSNTFKSVCDTSNYHLFNISNIGDEEKKRKIEYITGTKADEEKHLKQSMDVIYRQQNGLKSYYISANILLRSEVSNSTEQDNSLS